MSKTMTLHELPCAGRHRKLHLAHPGAQLGLQGGKVLTLQIYLEGLQQLGLLAEVTDLLGLDELGQSRPGRLTFHLV